MKFIKKSLMQGDFYRWVGIDPKKEKNSFHPEDCDFSDRCAGWNDFIQKYPELAKKLPEYRKQLIIQPIKIATFVDFLHRVAELEFCLLGKQAELKIDTHKVEQNLAGIKEILINIQKCEYEFVVPAKNGYYFSKDYSSPKMVDIDKVANLKALSAFKTAGNTGYILQEDKEFAVYSLYDFYAASKVYSFTAFRLLTPQAIHLPEVKFDGNNLVEIGRASCRERV